MLLKTRYEIAFTAPNLEESFFLLTLAHALVHLSERPRGRMRERLSVRASY